MERLVQIGQLLNGRWRVYSRTGKNLGTFSSKKAAQRRATQFERFVNLNKRRLASCQHRMVILAKVANYIEAPTVTYSSMVRNLRQNEPERVKIFMITFKQIFDKAVEQGLDDLEQAVLMETCQKLGIKK